MEKDLIRLTESRLRKQTMDRWELCADCPYPARGFVCWSENQECLLTRMMVLDGREDEVKQITRLNRINEAIDPFRIYDFRNGTYAFVLRLSKFPPYSGPSPSVYYSVGSISAKESVTDLGYEEDGYKLIEYSVTGSSYKKRGYYPSSLLSARHDSDEPMGGEETGEMTNYAIYTAGYYIPNSLPMGGAIVTQGFNDHSTNRKGHLGYDMCIHEIKPLFNGVVVLTAKTNTSANGRAVCVKHTINNITFYSTYCHLASVNVDCGDTVTASTVLGIMGGSAEGKDNYYSPHLHVCVYTGSPTVNPYGYCYKNGEKSFEDTTAYYNEYYYGASGSEANKYPRCGGVRFYDPYGVVTSGAAVIAQYS